MNRQEPVPMRVRLVTWELTRACKLECMHCTVGAREQRSPAELSTYEAYKAIDGIALLRPDELIITGGDPLERPDIFQLIDYAVRRGVRPLLNVSATANLAGSAISKLRRHGLTRMGIALESSKPDRHDAARGLSGQFAATLQAIRWARTAGIGLEVNTLAGRHNIDDLQTLSNLLTDLGVERWNVYFPVPLADRKADMLTAEETDRIFEQLYAIGQKSRLAIRTFEAPHFRRFVLQKELDARKQSLDRYFDSGAELDAELERNASSRATTDCKETLFISHSGEVTISPFLALTSGNIRYQSLASIYGAADMFVALRDENNLRGKCGRCEFRSLCGGSRARAFITTGDLFATDPLCSYEPGQFAPVPIVNHEAMRP